MEINITWNICRVCLEEEQKNAKNSNEGPMRKIFSRDNKLAKQIFECSGITMKPNDSLPDKICQKCISVLKYALNFRKTCRNSDTYLQSVLQRTKLASSLFKPETCIDFEDEIIPDNPMDIVEEDREPKEEPHEEQADEELNNKEMIKRKRRGSRNVSKTFKTINSIDDSSSSILMEPKENYTNIEPSKNVEDMVAQVNEEQDDTDHDGDRGKVEVEEETIENSDEIMEQIFSNTTEENSHLIRPEEDDVDEATENYQEHSIKDLKHKPSGLQVFYENSNYTKLSDENQHNKTVVEDSEHTTDDDYDLIETHETDLQNLKQDNNDEMYYQFKAVKNENRHNIPNDEEDNIHVNEDDHNDATEEYDNKEENHEIVDNVDFIPIDEEEHEMMLHLEQDMEDNQSLVTSTVITNGDEGDNFVDNYNEQNSNESQGLRSEYVIDEYLVENSNSDNSSRNSYITTRTKKQQKNSNKKRNPVILAGRRSKNKVDPIISGSKKIFICSICGNHFNNRQVLNAHLKVHRQEKNHECEICFKRFITACNLQAHMRIHTGEKPYECQYCGRRFNDRSSNLRHERIHTNEKPFHCEQCGKSFALSTTLQAHLKVHTGERSYRCETCSKSFKLPHQLKAHQKTTLHKAVEQLVKLEN